MITRLWYIEKDPVSANEGEGGPAPSLEKVLLEKS